MDTISLVETQIEDGQKLLDQLTEEEFALSLACWVNPVRDDRWSLLIATPSVDQKGLLAAYHKVFATLRTLGEVSVMDSEIKLAGHNKPVDVRNDVPLHCKISGSKTGSGKKQKKKPVADQQRAKPDDLGARRCIQKYNVRKHICHPDTPENTSKPDLGNRSQL